MRTVTAIAIGAALLAVVSMPARAACLAEVAKVEQTMQSASLQDAEAAVKQVHGSLTCEPWEELKADALLATRLIAEARKIDPTLKHPQAAILIERAAQPAVEWRSLDLRGRQLRAAGKFREATDAFQQAINLVAISGAPGTPAGAWKNEASKDERANLARQADETKHLAASSQGVLVAAATDRAGNPGGVFSPAIDRGAVGLRVPVPILFEYDSAKLTRIGTEAAQEFVSFLKAREPKSITVTGHTDRVGGEAYNMDLSKRRAAIVAAFLKEAGVNGRIVTVGKGFSEPWKISDGADYTQSQIDELNRRVEFDWN